MDKVQIAAKISEECGISVNPDCIVKLPYDGCNGHMLAPRWDVYAVRAGEFTLIAYAYSDGEFSVFEV